MVRSSHSSTTTQPVRLSLQSGHQDAKSFAESILKQMTLEEKVLLLTGNDMWRTNAIPRLGVSQIKTSDGPLGVRGSKFVDGVSAASPPTGVSLGATWDREIMKAVCTVLVSEAESKEADVLLGPTVCIPRTPLGGRNFEAYSEDPFLAGKLAATFINTIQAGGVGACIKHFAANDQETRRFFIDEKIPDRALREVHLQAFQIAIRDSNPWTLMTAYNKINGTFCSGHMHLLRTILRDEWKWDGLVMSDWFGTNSVVPALKASMDLEMPGPVRRRGKHLLEAHRRGLIDVSYINESASRVLELVHKVGKSDIPSWKEGIEQAIDLPDHRVIFRRAGAAGIVLLKNSEGILPLENLQGKSIAIVGPHAARSVASAGGSSNLFPHYRTTPYDSLKRELATLFPTAKVRTAPGMLSHRYLPLIDLSCMRNPVTGEPGVVLEVYRNLSHSGTPAQVEHRPSSHVVCYDTLPPELTNGERYTYRVRTILTPKTTGRHQFSLSSCGSGRLMINGETLINIERTWRSPTSSLFLSYGSPEESAEIDMEANKEYEVVLQSTSREPKPYQMTFTGDLDREEVMDGGRIGFLEQYDKEAISKTAIELAQSSDIAIVVVGKDAEWEGETSDMVSMDLPHGSNELITTVAQVNPNTIVVNQTGSPISMPWLNQISTVVQAWYQGQEQGNCLADVLLGKVNPSGKLPITFPRRIEDNPSYGNYPGGNDVVYYGEGIYSGYRFYDNRKIEPLFPFGFGLSYTKFEYSNIRLSGTVLACDGRGPGEIEVLVDIKNVGQRDGKEVVQFYVSQVTKPRLDRPPRELKGWDKVYVRTGETVTARTTLDRVSVSYWDDKPQKWVIDENAEFAVIAAANSRDPGLSASFRSAGPVAWVH